MIREFLLLLPARVYHVMRPGVKSGTDRHEYFPTIKIKPVIHLKVKKICAKNTL